MSLQYHDPDDLSIDDENERKSLDTEMEDGEFVDDDFEQLRKSIEEMGIVQPPMTRIKTDGAEGEHLVVTGQRRVVAAREAEGVEEIPVVVMEWDDEEALRASITENIGLFTKRVGVQDRCAALERLWEQMGGSGMPVQSHLAAKLGVPRETVRTWLEPLHDGWKDTTIDPSSDGESDVADELGEKALAIIRRMTGGGEDGEAVAERAAELGLTQSALKDAKALVEEEDYEPMDAIEEVAPDDDGEESEEDDGPTRIEVNEVTFDPETSAALERASEDHDSPPAALILNAVDWFLEEEGYLD